MGKIAAQIALCLCFSSTALLRGQDEAVRVRYAFGGNVVQVPMRLADGRIFVPVRVNQSQPSEFLLDMTAAESGMDEKRTAELGLAQASGSAIPGPTLEMPGVEIFAPSLREFSLGRESARIGQPVAGILGTDLLSRFVVEVNYQRGVMHLYEPSSFQYAGKGANLPLAVTDGVPQVRAKVSMPGQKPFEADFALATGDSEAISFCTEFAESHHLLKGHLKTILNLDESDPDSKSVLVRIRGLQIGPYGVEEPIAGFFRDEFCPPGRGTALVPSEAGGSRAPADASRTEPLTERAQSKLAGTLGGRFLERFTFFLDLPHSRSILEPDLHFGEYSEADMSGMRLRAAGPSLRTLEIVSVISPSPASDAGLQKGDVIAAIDQQFAADLTLADVHEMFRQVGHEYRITVQRDAKTFDVKLRMRRLI